MFRLLLATVLPSLPLLLMRMALHLKSGVLNADYFLLALLACGWSPAVASVLFVLTYLLELARLLDALYYFSGSDPVFALRFIGEVQKQLVLGWAAAALLLCGFSLWVWRAALPHLRGRGLWLAALPVAGVLLLLGSIDEARGFALLGSGRHVRSGYRMVDEVLMRMPLSLAHPAKATAVAMVGSASDPLWQTEAYSKAHEDVVLVLVESMGQLLDHDGFANEFQLFQDPALRRRYTVTMGLTAFTGSTVSGEMRELCHERTGTYVPASLLSGNHAPCLPLLYRNAGYQATAFHGFRGSMFQRSSWYPQLGFAKQQFLADMGHLPACEGAFFGVCDAAVAGLLQQQLRAHAAGQLPPQFLYWVTLNSHLPVNEGSAPSGTCPVQARGPVCAQLAYVQRVLSSVKELALDPKIGRTAILLVGDHAPPFLVPDDRARFDQAKVPYVYLEPK